MIGSDTEGVVGETVLTFNEVSTSLEALSLKIDTLGKTNEELSNCLQSLVVFLAPNDKTGGLKSVIIMLAFRTVFQQGTSS